MTDVRATIQILVDFHGHMLETDKVLAMTAMERKAFLKACALALHAARLDDFVNLTQSAPFNPLLALDATDHPSPADLRAAMKTAIDAYNAEDFGQQFTLTGTGTPPPTCIRWVWINGEWRAVYNYDLVASNAPSKNGLAARYHVALTYPRSLSSIPA
jgi:hypothetical protein